MEKHRRCRSARYAVTAFAAVGAIVLVAAAEQTQKVPPVSQANAAKAASKLAASGSIVPKKDPIAKATPAAPRAPLYDLVAYVRNATLPAPPKMPGQSLPTGTLSECKGSPAYSASIGSSASALSANGPAATGQTTTGTTSSTSSTTSAGSPQAATPLAPCQGWTPVVGTYPDNANGVGDWIGNKGIGYGIEAFSVNPRTTAMSPASWPSCLQLEYMAHIPGLGDTGWYAASTLVGTPGSGKYVEGIAFRLSGTCAGQYAITYNCHLRGLGDQTILGGPGFCGTRGQGRPLESFVVYVNPAPPATAAAAPSTPGKSTVAFSVSKGSSLVKQADGSYVTVDDSALPDNWLGTRGQGIALTAFAVKPSATGTSAWPSCLKINYMAHVSGIGDTGWYDSPTYVNGSIEGVAFKLDGTCAANYVVEYQCHLKGIGDVPLMAGPSFCGTRGQGRRLEAVKLTVRQR